MRVEDFAESMKYTIRNRKRKSTVSKVSHAYRRKFFVATTDEVYTNVTTSSHCTYSGSDFAAASVFPYFVNGESARYCYPPGSGPEMIVDSFEVPSPLTLSLVNLFAITPMCLLLAWLLATVFPQDTGVNKFGAACGGCQGAGRGGVVGAPPPRNCVMVRNVSKSYGDKTVVHDVSATMREGEVFALLGHNGAGED